MQKYQLILLAYLLWLFVFFVLLLLKGFEVSQADTPTPSLWLQGYGTGVDLTEEYISTECERFGVFYINEKAYECKEQP